MRRLWIILLAAIMMSPALAVIESYEFDSDMQRARYNAFVEELRCPKCQNQNLSGSDSEIARDLRRQVHQMIVAGKSDIEITQYMVDRYGDFILYRPRFGATTAVLWVLPVLLVLIGFAVWWRMASRRSAADSRPAAAAALSDAERQKLRELREGSSDDA